jgi:hypothetical protein
MPEMNGFWIDGTFRPADAVHLGSQSRCGAAG